MKLYLMRPWNFLKGILMLFSGNYFCFCPRCWKATQGHAIMYRPHDGLSTTYCNDCWKTLRLVQKLTAALKSLRYWTGEDGEMKAGYVVNAIVEGK